MRLILTVLCLVILFSCKDKVVKLVSMEEDVEVLADDSFSGRETGTIGEIKASQYIARRYEEIGLEMKGSDGYFQEFSFKPSVNPHKRPNVSDSVGDGLIYGRNVVGFINNNAPTTVVIGAHYDHLGLGGVGSLHRDGEAIHNGADDNASGVAIMLRLAHTLAFNDTTESNNFVFVAFSGEEMGLLGSAYWVKNATVDISTVNYMINMDMVGRLNAENTLAVHGVGTSPIFKQTLFANNEQGLNLAEHESGVGPSDHTSFYIADIPVLHFFTGQHEDYHKPSDDSEKLNYQGMTTISHYILAIVKDLDDHGKIAFRKTKDESEEVPAFKVGLGVVPDYLFTGKGMRIDGVSEDRPAQKAGLQKGDIVVQMGDSTVVDLMSYMKVLATYDNGQKAKVIVDRDGQPLEVEVEF